ncbi:CRISPR-associated protein, GSU0054 family [Sesbania bispinosa]|nr:CRISPR-associated protein, GSU0054 family [Sesbania bispinosa]
MPPFAFPATATSGSRVAFPSSTRKYLAPSTSVPHKPYHRRPLHSRWSGADLSPNTLGRPTAEDDSANNVEANLEESPEKTKTIPLCGPSRKSYLV